MIMETALPHRLQREQHTAIAALREAAALCRELQAGIVKRSKEEAGKGAAFSKADLSRATLIDGDLSRADLSDADFNGSTIGFLTFTGVDLSAAKGLTKCIHYGPSAVDYMTLERSGKLPEIFLRGCGFSDLFIDYIPSIFGAGGIEFYSCFISHSSADKEFGSELGSVKDS